MTEDQIERTVESRMDRLDRRYLAGALTEIEYKTAVAELDAWAEAQLTAIPCCWCL